MKFDGNTRSITIPGSALSSGSTDNFTVSLWFNSKGDSVGSPGDQRISNTIISNGRYCSSGNEINQGWMICHSGTTIRIGYGIAGSGGWYLEAIDPSYKRNSWIHVVYVRKSSTGDNMLYINGVLKSSNINISGDIHDETKQIRLGIMSAGNYYNFNGIIDDVRIYNRALSAKEIQTLYKAGGGVVQASASNVKTNTNGVGLSNGLIGHWTFDGKNMTNATATDVSGMGNNGTLMNMTATSSKIAGKIGQALTFNDSKTQYINLNNPEIYNLTSTSTMTVSAWVKTPSSYSGGKSAFVKRGFAYSSGDHNNQYGLQSTGGRFEFSLGDGASGVVAMTSAGFAKTNTWYFVTGIIDSNNAYLYVNGVLQDTKIRPVGSPPVSDFMAIGTFNINQNYWRGIIDDARIYNRALSSKEVYSLYKLGQTVTDVSPTNKIGTGISSGLVGHWTFDGKDTNWTSSFVGTTKDSSGNNNTGNFSQMGRATSTIIGKIGQGLTFHGNDVINTTKPILSSTASNGFSTLVWLKDINSPIGSIVYELDGSTSLYLETGKTTGTRCVIRDDITSFFYTPYSTSNLDHKWHHYGCVLDRTTNVLTMYIDTASTSSVYVGGAGGVNSFRNYLGYFHLGGRMYNNSGIIGSIDDMRVYNRTLSPSEIKAIYKLGSQ